VFFKKNEKIFFFGNLFFFFFFLSEGTTFATQKSSLQDLSGWEKSLNFTKKSLNH